MKTNELRIGNWFIEYDEPQQFDGDFYHLIGIKPIPLTEKWLLKFGVQPNKWFCENSFCIIEDKTGDTHYGWCMKVQNASHTKEIEFACFKYVHQLQNLYFALTGEELTIKL